VSPIGAKRKPGTHQGDCNAGRHATTTRTPAGFVRRFLAQRALGVAPKRQGLLTLVMVSLRIANLPRVSVGSR
jgi:hypothetical protein